MTHPQADEHIGGWEYLRSFTCEGCGRLKTDTSSGNTTVYSWDAESRLVGMTKPGLTTSYGYNGLDARTSKTVGASTTTYKRAGAYVADPVLNETTGQFSANYTPGVSERRAGVSTFLHSGLKNADARTTDGASVTAERQYDAFGNLTGGNGTWNGPFGYAGGFGYQEDGESGLKLLGHRYYDSTTGRFLSKDPIGDGRNWTAYCGNNPVIASDPTGLLAWVPLIVGGMILLDIIDAYQDAKEIVKDPTNPKVYIAPILGVIDPTPGNVGKKVLKRLDDVPSARSVQSVVDEIPASRVKRVNSATLRHEWERQYGKPWPKDEFGRNYDFAHKRALADGGDNSISNIEPLRRGASMSGGTGRMGTT